MSDGLRPPPDIVSFTVPGDPVAKERPRLGRNGNVFTPHRTRLAESIIWARWRSAVGPGVGVLTGPVRLELRFDCATRQRVDIDNLSKTVLDALNGRAYHDDAQVLQLRLEKRLGMGKVQACTAITITSLDNCE